MMQHKSYVVRNGVPCLLGRIIVIGAGELVV